jgi:hypothetical protein
VRPSFRGARARVTIDDGLTRRPRQVAFAPLLKPLERLLTQVPDRTGCEPMRLVRTLCI